MNFSTHWLNTLKQYTIKTKDNKYAILSLNASYGINNSKYNSLEIVEKVNLLSKHLIDCDFVIVSNGRTVFEIASLNIPLISLSVNKREQQHNFVKKFNVGYHIDYTKNIDGKLKSSIENMMHFSTRKKKIKNLEKEDLKKGISRVITKIMSEYELVMYNA